jgi:hypothetical protein
LTNKAGISAQFYTVLAEITSKSWPKTCHNPYNYQWGDFCATRKNAANGEFAEYGFERPQCQKN